MSGRTWKEYKNLGSYYTFYSQANPTSSQCPPVTSFEGEQGSGIRRVLGALNPFPCSGIEIKILTGCFCLDVLFDFCFGEMVSQVKTLGFLGW